MRIGVPGRWITCVLVVALGCCTQSEHPLPSASSETVAFPPAPAGTVRSVTADRLLLKGVAVVDGTGAPAQEGQDILIVGGKIADMRASIDDLSAVVLDMAGQTVLPGLIDCHAHTQSVPGAVLRGDSPELIERQRLLQLRAYLASGVTTVLDTGISRAMLLRFRRYLAEGEPGPSLIALSPFLTPKGGYFGTEGLRTAIYADIWESVEGTYSIGRQLREAVVLSPLGVKVTVERGMVFPIWPVFSTEQLATIKQEAANVGLLIFVHSMNNEAHRMALTLEPYAMVHVGLGHETIEPDVLESIKRSGAYVISTLSVFEMETWFWDQTAMQQPWIEARVPIAQWQTANDPTTRNRGLDMMTPLVTPTWIPSWLARAGAPFVRSAKSGQRELASSQRAVRAMHEAGIPIVMGADAGNWPVFTTFFHGVGSLVEMRLLEEAGVPRNEVIVAATSRAAKMLKQDDRIGTVRIGMDADLIVVADNPLEHGMQALQEISWVIKRGVAKTPQAWLSE